MERRSTSSTDAEPARQAGPLPYRLSPGHVSTKPSLIFNQAFLSDLQVFSHSFNPRVTRP